MRACKYVSLYVTGGRGYKEGEKGREDQVIGVQMEDSFS